MRKALLIAAILAVLFPAISHSEEPVEAKRRIVYVPHDQMDLLVARHGRGVVLDASEYLALWSLAKQGRLDAATRPVTGAVILSGELIGRVTDEVAEITVEYRIRILEKGLQRVPFPLLGSAVGEVRADGRPALVSRDPGGDYLLLQGTGDHIVSVTLSRKVERKEEIRFFRTSVPPGASMTLDLGIPRGMEPVEGTLGGTWRSEESEQGTRVVGQLPPTSRILFSFRPRRVEGARSAYLASRGRTLHRVGPRLLESVVLAEVTIHRRRVRELAFRVPGDSLVTKVAAPNLAGWQVGESDGRLRLVFRHDTGGTIPVVVSLERILDGPGEIELPEVRLEGAASEAGMTGVTFIGGVEGRIVNADGYVRVAIPAARKQQQKGQANRPAPSAQDDLVVLAGASAAYRYWSADRAFRVKTEERRGVLEAEVTAVYRLREAVRELHASFRYVRKGERVYRIAPTLPPEFELLALTVTAPSPHTWERRDDGTVVIDFPSGVNPDTPIGVTALLRKESEAWRSEDWTERTLPIPVPDAGAGEIVQGRIAVIADLGFEVRDRELRGLKPEPVERLGLPGARLGYRWRGATALGELVVTREEPKVSVNHIAVVAPGEKTARYTGFLQYTIKRAGVRKFRFSVSPGVGDLLRVTAPGTTEPVRARQEDGSDLWEITLPRKVIGDLWIGLSLEEDMELTGGRRGFSFPEVRVLDVEAESGWLAVQSGDNMEVRIKEETGLRAIGLEEMEMVYPKGFKPSRGLLAAYQYSAHPVSLAMESVEFEDMEVLAAFVRSAHLRSVVGSDGVIRTRATYQLLNTDRQTLRVRLPEGSALWGALVAGKPVKPSSRDGEALVPLQTTAGGAAVSVVLIYETVSDSLGASGFLDLAAPVLPGVTGAEATWEIWLPTGYRVTTARGVFGGGDPRPGDPWLFRAVEDLFTNVLSATGGGFAYEASDRSPPASAADGPPLEEGEGEARWREDRDDDVVMDAPARHRPAPAKKPMEPKPDARKPADPEAGPVPPADHPPPFGGPAGAPSADPGSVPVPPVRLGRAGGLSLDVPLLSGGSPRVVRALGAGGSVRISYSDGSSRKALSFVLSVLTALVGVLLSGLGRPPGGIRVAPLVYVVVVAALATFAPWWFGARDLALWDAVARGAILAGVVLFAIGLARRLAPATSGAGIVAVAVALALLSSPAYAQKKPAPKPKPAPVAEEGEVVYVPYDPEQIGDLDRAGKVFLPFAEFQKLWNAAHPDRPIEEPEQAPVPWLLTGAAYRGTVEEETARIEATYDLVVLDKGWVEVSLPLAPAVVDEALVDGEPVRFLSRKGAHVLVLRGEGARRVTLTLRVLFRQEGDRRILEMSLPAIPRSLLEFTLPLEDAEVTLEGPVAPVVEGSLVRALLGPTGALLFSYRPKTEAPRIEARVQAETRETLSVLEGRSIFRMRTQWRVVSGEISEVEYVLDPTFELLTVAGPEVKSWSVTEGRLVVLLGREVKDGTSIELTAERADGVRARSVSVPATAPVGVVRERGLIAVAVSRDLRPTLNGFANVDRIAAKAGDFPGLFPAGAALHSAYRFVLRPLALTVDTVPVSAEIRAELPALYLIEREWLRSRTACFFDVRGDGTFEFSVRLPSDVELESVTGAGLNRWWRDGETLWLSTASPVRGRFGVEIHYRRRLDPDAEQVELPEIHAVGVARETGSILVAHAPGMSLTIVSDRGLVKQDIALFRSWQKLRPDQVDVYGYRQDEGEYKLTVARSFPEARVRPVATTHLQVEEESVVVDAHLAFAIENAGEDTFQVFLPGLTGENPLLVADRKRRATWEDAEVDGRRGKMLTLVLQQEALGFYSFRVIYEVDLSREGDLKRGAATLNGPEPVGENPASYVYVVNLSPGEVTFGKAEGIETADPDTFPFKPGRQLILQAWRGRKAAWTLSIELTIHSFADFPDALISTAELLTAVGRDGLSRNRVTYRVLNRSRQFLEVSLPEGAQLEAVLVGGAPVKPGRRVVAGDTRLLVPLVRMQPGDISTEVEIVWSLQIGGESVDIRRAGGLQLLEPEVHGFEVEQTFYTVVLPEGYRYSFDGNMDPIEESVQRLYQAEQVTEELAQVAEVQLRGNLAQQDRAASNFLVNRGDLERTLNFLNDSRNLVTLNAEQRRKLKNIQSKLGSLDQTVALGSEQLRASRGSAPREKGIRAGQAGRQELAKVAAETKKLAESQKEMGYRFKGKSNVVTQKWEANTANDASKQAADEYLSNKNILPLMTFGDREVETHQRAFQQLQAGQVVQGDLTSFERTGFGRVRSTIGLGGGAGGTFRGPAGEVPPSQRGLFSVRGEATARAGLLSLPVTVPTAGVIYRFEKRNGGAELEVSVGDVDPGRGPAGLGWFALAMAILVALRRWRPDRKYAMFGPVLLLLAGLLAFMAGGFPLALLAILGSIVWFVLKRRATVRYGT